MEVIQEAKNTYLVPFNFQTFRTGEAVWSLDKHELIKMFRVTRRGVGEFLNPESRDPQKIIDKIIERNPHLKTSSIPVTVTGMTGQKYITKTFDIWGVYQIAIVSKFPRAKIFLQEFPNFLQAFHDHTIKPPAIGDIKPEIIGFFGVPRKERGNYVQAVCIQYGWQRTTFYRKVKNAMTVLAVLPQFTRKPRSDSGETKYPGERERAIAFFLANLAKLREYGNRFKEMPKKIIKKTLNLHASESTINRWIRRYKNESCLC